MTKSQLPNKSQYPNSNYQTVWNLIIDYWLLFGIWCLVIGYLLTPFSASADIKASVEAIQATYQSISDLQADFVQTTYVAILDTTVKEPGIFSMKKPGMLRIKYTGEHPKQYISNGKRLWIINTEVGQVETYAVSEETIPREALEFLKGFGEMERLFVVKEWRPKKIQEGHVYLTLVPKTGSAQYKKLDCDFGPDNFLKAMTIHNKSGNLSTYVFNNIRVNVGLSDNLFTFK